MNGALSCFSMFLKAATKWRGCRSCAPRPKIAVVIFGLNILASAAFIRVLRGQPE